MISTPMMLLLNTEDAQNHDEIRKSVQEIAQTGFEAVCLEFRNSQFDEFDAVGQAAMQVCYEEAKRCGIGFVKIVPHASARFLKANPELYRRVLKEIAMVFTPDQRSRSWHIQLSGVKPSLDQAFRIQKNENGEITNAERCEQEVQYLISGEQLQIRVKDAGEYLFYFSCETTDADYANPAITNMLDAFLAAYAPYKLDGYAMDEFGAGSCEAGVYLSSESFLTLFEATYGYDLRDKLYLLQNRGTDTEFAVVRYDYYTLTNTLTLNYQMAAREKFEAKYGKDLFIGFHHTWWGEGNSGDLWAGNIDYFRLCKALTGGFVDAQYDTERTMLSMTQLAESIARYSDTGNAYNMCWDRYCTPRKMDYYHRMLAARNVKWVSHALAKSIRNARWRCKDITVGFSSDVQFAGLFADKLIDNPLWGDISKCIRWEHSLEKKLCGANSPAKVAVLYIWESNAFFNNEQMHYHRASLKALLDKLMTNNIPIDVVPSFETNLSHYDVIFALWPSMMPDPLWQALKQEIAAGKQIYFMGPPAYVTTSGKDISAEFEKLTGSHVTAVKTYCGGYEYPAWDFWFTDKIIPMNIYCEGDEIIERSCGNVHYYGYEAPLTEAMIDVIENLSDYKTIDNDRVISKVYQRSDEKIITLTGRWSCKINMRFAFEGNDIEIQNGTLILISAEKNKITKLLSSGGAQIYINGIRSDYEQI